MALFFISTPLPLRGPTAPARRPSTCKRVRPPTANINKTTDSSREDEIAAKIASLRKQKRLKSKDAAPAPDATSDATPDAPETQATAADAAAAASPVPKAPAPDAPEADDRQDIGVFSSLPDWKKEELLNETMAEAENFFNRGVAGTESYAVPVPDDFPKDATPDSSDSSKEGEADDDDDDDDDYKPKVSTWGVFPRPDNISRTYGGGRTIKPGGPNLQSAESKKRDAAIAERLAAYRAARGIDVAREEAHREEIEAALERADALTKRTRPYDALDVLTEVAPLVSARSRLGGRVLLAQALSFDAVGRRDEARELYVSLRGSPFPEISSKAKQLLQGFDAMEKLGVTDSADGSASGLRVADFRLPDVNEGLEGRYETAVIGKDAAARRAEKVSTATNLGLFALIAGPLLLVGLLALARH